MNAFSNSQLLATVSHDGTFTIDSKWKRLGFNIVVADSSTLGYFEVPINLISTVQNILPANSDERIWILTSDRRTFTFKTSVASYMLKVYGIL